MKTNEVKMFKVADLEDADYNPRSITPSMLEKLKKGLVEFGCVEPVIANVATGSKSGKARLVGGHQRLKAARELGWTEIPCVMINESDVKKEKALNLALNKISGEWAFDKLSTILSDISDGDFDMELSGFDEIEIKELDDIDTSMSTGFAGFEPAKSGSPPESFPSFDDDIHTDYRCPKCAYEWSGKAR